MKRKILLNVAWMMFMLPIKNYAQYVDPVLVQKYPPSVIVRLYDVVSLLPELTRDKQDSIAQLFVKEDEIILKDVIAKQPRQLIESRKNATLNQISGLMSREDYNLYFLATAKEKAVGPAKIMANYIKYKYNGDKNMQIKFFNYYHDLFSSLYSDHLLSTKLYEHEIVLKDIDRKNELINTSLISVKSYVFIKNKVDSLSKIKSLNEQKKNDVYNYFISNYAKDSNRSFESLYEETLRQVLKDPAYKLIADQSKIELDAKTATQTALNQLTTKYYINKTDLNDLEKIIYKKRKEIAVLNLKELNMRKRDSLEVIIQKRYQPYINEVLLREGHIPPTSKFSLAIKNKAYLNLSKSQIDTLLSKNTQYDLLKSGFAKNSKSFIPEYYMNKNMTSILNKDQYAKFLNVVYDNDADKTASADWAEMNLIGIASGDSTTIIKQLKDYHLKLLVTKKRPDLDMEQQKATIRSIEANMPAELRKLVAARRNPNSEANIKKGYAW